MKDFFKKPIKINNDNYIIAGVCGGIAKTLNIDPFWVRLIYFILAFNFEIFFIIYILLALIME